MKRLWKQSLKMLLERFSDKNKLSKNNLTDTNKNARRHFSKPGNLVLTKAHQGGAIVILDVKDDVSKSNEQLQDNSFHKKLNVDHTAKRSKIFNSAIESFRKQELLSNSKASKLTVDSTFYPKFINLTYQEDL